MVPKRTGKARQNSVKITGEGKELLPVSLNSEAADLDFSQLVEMALIETTPH